MVILTIYVYHDLKPRLNQRLNWPKKRCKKPFFSLPILKDQKIAISILVQRLIDQFSILPLYRHGQSFDFQSFNSASSYRQSFLLIRPGVEVIKFEGVILLAKLSCAKSVDSQRCVNIVLHPSSVRSFCMVKIRVKCNSLRAAGKCDL